MMLDCHHSDASRTLRGAINGTGCGESEAIKARHRRCGVYTTPDVAGRIPETIGWCAGPGLCSARPLEPDVGDGEFVALPAERLVACGGESGTEPKIDVTRDTSFAFELHPDPARKARSRAVSRTWALGIHHWTTEAFGEAGFFPGKAAVSPCCLATRNLSSVRIDFRAWLSPWARLLPH